MWLLVILVATITVSLLYVVLKEQRKSLKLGFLALMLWGTFLMVLVDHTMAFLSGKPFLQVTTTGLIRSGTLLGVAMITPIFAIWIVAVAHAAKRAP